jgi:ribosomal protein L4
MKKQKVRTEGKTRNHFVVINDPVPENPTKEAMSFLKKLADKRKEVVSVEMKRTIPPKKLSLRRELENYVVAWNTVLRDAVGSMNIVTLLRNAHPAYRPAFASACAEVGLLTEFEAGEFRIGPAPRQHLRTNWQA